MIARFDMALSWQEAALSLVKASAGQAPATAIHSLTTATTHIRSSISTFTTLSTTTTIKVTSAVDPKTVAQRLSYSSSLLDMIGKKLEEAERKEATRLEQLSVVQAERERAEEKKREEERERVERKRRQAERDNEQCRLLQEQVMASSAAVHEGSGDAVVDEDEPMDRQQKGKRGRTSRKRKSSDTNDGTAEEVKSSPSKLSKEFVSSSSDEDELDTLFES
jgi:hypothetical protein